MSKLIAYKLTPIYELPPAPDGSLVRPAVMKCMATGDVLSGNNGDGEFLSPEIVQAFRDFGRIGLTEMLIKTGSKEEMDKLVVAFMDKEERTEQALMFYAREANYNDLHPELDECAVMLDHGSKARVALGWDKVN